MTNQSLDPDAAVELISNPGSNQTPVPSARSNVAGNPIQNVDLGPQAYATNMPNQLGANPNTQSTNKVNWLNSSYSGTDITIVAHLHTDNADNAVKQLTMDKDIADKVSAGAGNCLIALPQKVGAATYPNNNWIQLFKNACFPGGTSDPTTNAAFTVINQNLGSFVPGVLSGNPTVTGQFGIACSNLFYAYQSLTKELTSQLQNQQKQQQQSSSIIELGQCQTFSVQSHREKMAVRTLGRTYSNGYTRGPRTLAGSIIFTVFDEHPLSRLMRAMYDANLFTELTYNDYATMMIDQMPPIDLTIVFANEYGSFSRMGVYGVEFVNDGLTLSIEDMFLEDVVQFTAMDLDIMTSVGTMKLSQANQGIIDGKNGQKLSASSLYTDNYSAYNSYCTNQLGISKGFFK